MTKDRILIIGGGIIGLALGWQLTRRNFLVEIFEARQAGHAASWIAAGMLAPQTEAGFEEQELLAFGLESLKQYPRFLEELRQDSGQSVALNTEGTLVTALDRDDVERLQRFYHFRRQLNLQVQWLTGSEAREKEPFLSAQTLGAVSIPDDGQIDPRELTAALQTAFKNRGGNLHEHTPVKEVIWESGKITGIATETETIHASAVVIAAGCKSAKIEGIPEELRPRVRPIKGQVITLIAQDSCRLTHVIRGPEAYLVPKNDGRILVGATNEDMGFDRSSTAGPIKDLLEGALDIVPSLYDCVLQEIQVGLRPGTYDNLPILGATSMPGLYYATGHYRNGILLTPVTAYAMANLIETGHEPRLSPFSPSRFAPKETRCVNP